MDLQRQQRVERKMFPDPKEEERKKELEMLSAPMEDDRDRRRGGREREMSPRRY